MPLTIREADVTEALRRLFGSRFLAASGDLTDRLTALLRTFEPGKTAPELLSRRVEDLLVHGLYAVLGRSMMTVLDTGEVRRIRSDDLPDLADGVMGVLYDALEPNTASFALLRACAMEQGSLSAMATLYRRYVDWQPAAERQLLARIIADRSPGGRLPEWLSFPG